MNLWEEGKDTIVTSVLPASVAPLPYPPLAVATSQRLLDLRHDPHAPQDVFPWLRPQDGRALAALEPVGTPWSDTVRAHAWPPQLSTASALASVDPAELVWLLAERSDNAAVAQRACDALAERLTADADNQLRAAAVGASAVLAQVLTAHRDKAAVVAAAHRASVALALTAEQRTRRYDTCGCRRRCGGCGCGCGC